MDAIHPKIPHTVSAYTLAWSRACRMWPGVQAYQVLGTSLNRSVPLWRVKGLYQSPVQLGSAITLELTIKYNIDEKDAI